MSSRRKCFYKSFDLNFRSNQITTFKRPNSAVAARKNRGGSGAMMNNYSRGGNTDLSRTRPKNMLQDKVNNERIYSVKLIDYD